MTFKSIDELKNYILSRSEIAIKLAEERVYLIIGKFLEEYYREFKPEVYVRTFQLLRSLVKTDVVPTVNGWKAEVYFDISRLDYSIRTVPWQFVGIGKPQNTYHKARWTDENTEWVLETAMTGGNTGLPHGGFTDGTAIWTDSMEVLNAEKINILKESLLKAGIPVR